MHAVRLGPSMPLPGLQSLLSSSSLSSVPLIRNSMGPMVQPTSSFQPTLSWSNPTLGSLPAPVAAASGLTTHYSGSGGLSLSPAADTIPQKLVEKARSGAFVEMREFLKDNIELAHHLQAMQSTSLLLPSIPGVPKPRFREITSLIPWLYCFITYVAVRTSDPASRDQLAYALLLIKEAQRHGGSGWLAYDRAFRNQAAIDPTKRWNTLDGGLQASTILGSAVRTPTFCTHCFDVDHSSHQCALTFLHPNRSQSSQPSLYRDSVSTKRKLEASSRLCLSWNKGRCIFPGTCVFRHVCAVCRLNHRACDCPDTPADSTFKRGSSSSGPRQPTVTTSSARI